MSNFGVNGAWSDTSGIVLSDTGLGYLALRYTATNNWFTVAVDSIVITPDVALDTTNQKDTTDTASGIFSYDLVAPTFQLWPNPAADLVTVSLEGAAEGTMIELLDATGKLHLRRAATHSSEQFDLSDYAPGLYFLSVSNEETHQTKRLMLRH